VKKTESCRELSGDELSKANIVDQEDEAYILLGGRRLRSEWYWSRYNPNLGLKVHAVALGAQRDILARADKIIARTLIHKWNCQQILRRLGASSFAN
jgi:hypothetical protein